MVTNSYLHQLGHCRQQQVAYSEGGMCREVKKGTIYQEVVRFQEKDKVMASVWGRGVYHSYA